MPHRLQRGVIPTEFQPFDGGYSALDYTRLRPNQFVDPYNQKAANWWRDRQDIVRMRDGNKLLIGSVGAVSVSGLFDFRRESDQINRLMLYGGAIVYASVQPALSSYAAVISGFANPPVVESSTGGVNTVTVSHTVTLPASIAVGELILIQFASASTTPTFPSGWTQIFDSEGGHSGNRITVVYRVANGTEGASITVTTPTAARSAYRSLRISGHGGSTNPPVASVGGYGQSTTPDSPALTPVGGPADFLWLPMISYLTTASPSAYPTNYISGVAYGTTEVGGGGGEVWIASAQRALYATSEDPGTFTIAEANGWHAVTIAVYPAATPAAVSTVGWGVSKQNAFWFANGVGIPQFYNPTYPVPTVTRIGIRKPTVKPVPALNSDAIGQPTIGTVSTVTTTGVSATVSHVVSGNERVLLVFVGVTPLTRVKSVTYGTTALTLLAAQNRGQHAGTDDCRIELWRLVNPASGTASVAVTMDASCNINVSAVTCQNIHQTTPFGSVVSAGGENTNPALTAISESGALVIDAIVVKSSVASDLGAVGAGQTERSRTNVSTAVMGVSTEPGAQAVDMNWTMPNSKPWAHLTVPLKNLSTTVVLPEDLFWRYTYVRENSGVKVIESNPSDETAVAMTGNADGPDADVRVEGSTDTQVTHVYLYRRSSISTAQYRYVAKAANAAGGVQITDDVTLAQLGAFAFWEPSGGEEDHGVPDSGIWALTIHRDDRMYAWTTNSEVRYTRVGQHHYWPGATDRRGGFIIAVAVDDGDEGMTILSEGDDLLLLKRQHVYRLIGEGPTADNGDPGSWKIEKIATQHGCIAKRSGAIGLAGAFWMAHVGPVQVDRASGMPQYIGLDIEQWVDQSTDKTAAYGQVVDHYFLLTLPFAGGPQTMVYDSRNGSWWPIAGMQVEGMVVLEDLRVVWAGRLGDGPQAVTYHWSDDYADDDGTAITASLLSAPMQFPVWCWFPAAELTVRATTWRPTLYHWRPLVHTLPRDRVSGTPSFSQTYSTLPSGDPSTGITLTTRLYADANANAYLERLVRAFGTEGARVTKRLPGDRRLQGRAVQLQVTASTTGMTAASNVLSGGPHISTFTSAETDCGAARTRATVRMSRIIPAASGVFTSIGYANVSGGPYTFTAEQTASAFEDTTLNGRYVVYKVRITGTATVSSIEVTVWH